MTERLHERYEIVEEIGRGGQGQMYLALDCENDERVAIKKLAIDRIDNWKALELFEREGVVLEQLDHPAIPRYIDAFSVANQAGGSAEFYLVQEFVDGTDLSRLIEQEERFSEDEIVGILREVLTVLQYLQSLNPPIIHRDLKPSNLIRREDGSIAVVDFGAIQATLPHATFGGSTIIGTSGFMPHEQFMGRAVPATDHYSLGATAVHLLSGVHPSDLPVERMRLRFHDVVSVSPGLLGFLDTMLEPSVEDRPATATLALDLLERSRTAGAMVVASPRDLAVSKEVAARASAHLPRASMVAIGAEVLPDVITALGLPMIGTAALAYAVSSLGVTGAAGYLGSRVLQDHPALRSPSEIALRPVIRPALWLAFWVATTSAVARMVSLGFDVSLGVTYVAQAAFFGALMVILGYTAGCAYRIVRPDGRK